MNLREDLLHFIWQYRLFNHNGLHTVSGKRLCIQQPGLRNTHSGPDFEQARICLDETVCAGHIEIHLRSSDWNTHGHQYDAAYNPVILHVVYIHDKEVYLADGSVPETLELKPLVAESLFARYRMLMEARSWIPCEQLIAGADTGQAMIWLNRMLVERMECKTEFVIRLLEKQHGDWEEVCHILIARSFGMKVNSGAFETLARSLPSKLLARYRDRPASIEALIFGQAGFLNDVFQEGYPLALQREYRYLRQAHQLQPMQAAQWKFLRMRPLNFPTIRLAQYAALCTTGYPLLRYILSYARDMPSGRLASLPVNEYWQTHYHFKHPSGVHAVQPGNRAIDNILINTFAVVLFAYGKYVGKELYIYQAEQLLSSIKPEANAITGRFATLHMKAQHAGDSQALLHLKENYCDKKRCLKCSIGLQIVKHDDN